MGYVERCLAVFWIMILGGSGMDGCHCWHSSFTSFPYCTARVAKMCDGALMASAY